MCSLGETSARKVCLYCLSVCTDALVLVICKIYACNGDKICFILYRLTVCPERKARTRPAVVACNLSCLINIASEAIQERITRFL